MRSETTQLAATTRLSVGWRYGPMQPAAITPLLAHKRSMSTKPAAKTRQSLASSHRLKKEMKAMDQTSEAILALKPVTFQYKSDTKGTPQFGLIAEEVAEVNPYLFVRDETAEIYTVRYEAVNAMLLNEF